MKPTNDTNTIPGDLQTLAQAGWRLFPLGSVGELRKRPAIEDWPTQASAALSQLRSWSQQFPACNWAVLTGQESQIFALDIDGDTGREWLSAQLSLHGQTWTETRTAATAKGFHYYFSWPDVTIRNSVGKIAPGVDIRGWHGYTVIPPSQHPSGVAYEWAGGPDRPILAAPSWLIQMALDAGKSDETSQPAANGHAGGIIAEGQRNAALTSLAGSMRRPGMSEQAILAALLAENALRCSPPLPEEEIQIIAASIARYDPAPPEPQLILPSRTTPAQTPKLFKTALEFSAQTPAATDWIIQPYIAAGSTVELTAKIKCGKTTYAMAMASAIVNGGQFLGQQCRKSGVVYLSEQPGSSLRAALQKAGLADSPDLLLMQWVDALGMGWDDIAKAAVEKSVQVGAGLLVVDTLGQFAQLAGDQENNAGTALEILKPLQIAPSLGVSVLLVRHERKSASEISDAGRGSSAFGGACDVLLRLRTLGANHAPTLRLLECLSRYEESPREATIELTPEGYVLCDSDAVLHRATEQELLRVLPTAESDAKTLTELTAILHKPRTTLQRILDRLSKSGMIRCSGTGKRNNPTRYHLLMPETEPETE